MLPQGSIDSSLTTYFLTLLRAGCSHTLGCWEMGDDKIFRHISTEESVRLLIGHYMCSRYKYVADNLTVMSFFSFLLVMQSQLISISVIHMKIIQPEGNCLGELCVDLLVMPRGSRRGESCTCSSLNADEWVRELCALFRNFFPRHLPLFNWTTVHKAL